MGKTSVLVVGGSGYLGLHLLQSLSTLSGNPYDLAFTYHSHPPPQALFDAIGPVQAFKLDLQSGEGLDKISATFGQPHVVVNCAALSVPRACESNTSAAVAINVPSTLIKWMSSFNDTETPLLIHLSTDQVYEGIKLFYIEEDETNPINVYGKSKVIAEEYIRSNYSNYAILRSSIIYGPQPVIPVEKSLPIQVTEPLVRVLRMVDGEGMPMGFIYEAMDRAKEAISHYYRGNARKCEIFWRIIDRRWTNQLHQPIHAFAYFLNPKFYFSDSFRADEEVMAGVITCIDKMTPDPELRDKVLDELEWIDSVLSSDKEVEFFSDEFRCPIYVKDIINVIESLIRKWDSGDKCIQILLNAGGPDRVSRAQMAKVVSDLRGYDSSKIKSVSAASVNRGVASPADISMDVSKLVKLLGINLTTFKDGVQLTLES